MINDFCFRSVHTCVNTMRFATKKRVCTLLHLFCARVCTDLYEINFGSSISGIKGFVGTVTIATDTVTNNGAEKELFNVSSDFIANNGY